MKLILVISLFLKFLFEIKSLEAAEIKLTNKLAQPDLPSAYEKLTLVPFFNRSSYDERVC